MGMMDGIGLAASLVQLAKGIQTCYQFIQDASNSSRDRQGLQLHLDMQRYLFQSWCNEAGILQDVASSQGAADEATLHKVAESLQQNLGIENADYALTITKYLEMANNKFEEAQGRLQTSATVTSSMKSFSGRLQKLKSGANPSSAKNTASTPTIASATKWALIDKRTLLPIIEELEKCNRNLQTCTSHAHGRDRIMRHATFQLVTAQDITGQRPVDGLSNHKEQLHGVVRLAELRAWKAREDSDSTAQDSTKGQEGGNIGMRRDSASDTTPMGVENFFIDDLVREKWDDFPTREIARLRDETILVEWRYLADSEASKDRTRSLEAHFSALVSVLRGCSAISDFKIPIPKGICKSEGISRYGIVYQCPLPGTDNSLQTLHDFIKATRTAKRVPYLGERFRLARDLALAVFQFHTVGWLHKSLRSDNIICFQRTSDDGDMYRLPRFFVAGFDFSRPSVPGELTESRPTADFLKLREEIESYSHPDSLDTMAQKRKTYTELFDYYSLGLILLEIGMWHPIRYLRSKTDDLSLAREKWKKEYCDELRHRTGEVYWKATKRALLGDFDLSEDNQGEQALPMAFDKLVISELEKLVA
jgi:hypothetical protein